VRLSHLLFSLNGRIPRRDFWLRFALPFALIFVVVAVAPPPLEKRPMLAFFGFALWPAIAVGVKRCHDRNRSGWFLLINLIPVVGPLWLLIELGFLRGGVGANHFGPDPLSSA
jgi:uncharacterized membrane protein YhaH (DUF805 family)